MNMNLLELSDGMPQDSSVKLLITSDTFEKMKKIATDLSSEFLHVRVNLYTVGDKIYFGEMTFFDGGGSTIFTPDEWNELFSSDWKIE